MGDGVVVLDPDFLIGLRGDNMRSVAAAALIEVHDRADEILVRRSGGNIDDDVLKAVIVSRDADFGHKRRVVELGTIGFGGHIDGFKFLGRAFIGDASVERAPGCGIRRWKRSEEGSRRREIRRQQLRFEGRRSVETIGQRRRRWRELELRELRTSGDEQEQAAYHDRHEKNKKQLRMGRHRRCGRDRRVKSGHGTLLKVT